MDSLRPGRLFGATRPFGQLQPGGPQIGAFEVDSLQIGPAKVGPTALAAVGPQPFLMRRQDLA